MDEQQLNKVRNDAGFIAALWATLLGLMAVVAPVADFRYEAGLIIIATAIVIATAITLVERRAIRSSTQRGS